MREEGGDEGGAWVCSWYLASTVGEGQGRVIAVVVVCVGVVWVCMFPERACGLVCVFGGEAKCTWTAVAGGHACFYVRQRNRAS